MIAEGNEQKGRAISGPVLIDFCFFYRFKDPKMNPPTMFLRDLIAAQFLGNLNERMIH
jgi:hypothetical protein